MAEKKPDMLLFFSDQHNALYTGYAGDHIVETPNLDQLAAEGTVFDNSYTSCPLCVPARASFLTGQLPSTNDIFTNAGAIGEDQATFIHSLAAEGYETVLCGRMHFHGEDQRHGFTKRIMGEMTPLFWGRGGARRADLGPFVLTLAPNRCLEVIGGGNSPVLEYDRAVIKAAIEYLNQDHAKPQCMVVGTYAPHFTYVAPPDLYNYYREKVGLPDALNEKFDYEHLCIDNKQQRVDDEVVLKARAAYYGMITNLDRQIGEVRNAWNGYLERNDRQGVFAYFSDHGDQVGERYLFGKQTFFEGSAKIPMVFQGAGIKAGNRVKGAVSILDIGPTLCELVDAQTPPQQDGTSLLKQLTNGVDDTERHVISEYMDRDEDRQFCPGRMVKKGNWKYITYHGLEDQDMLFNLSNDPFELHNLVGKKKEIVRDMRQLLVEGWEPEGIIRTQKVKSQHFDLLGRWGAAVDVEEKERWQIPESARQLPEIL